MRLRICHSRSSNCTQHISNKEMEEEEKEEEEEGEKEKEERVGEVHEWWWQ